MSSSAVELTAARHSRVSLRLLTLYCGLLLLVPSNLVVGALGSAGSPFQILGLGLALALAAWALTGVRYRYRDRATRAITAAAAALFLCVLLSYVMATTRPIGGTELSSADRGMLSLVSWLGITLFALNSGLDREQLNTLLRRLVAITGVVALIGVAQFLTGQVIVDRISIPGLVANSSIGGVESRGGFTRPAGTASHPIEFGVVLTLMLPVALHYAMHDTALRARLARWWPVLAIALAIPQSLSRTALLCLAVGLACVMPGWTPGQRRAGLASLAGACVLFYLTIPGFLGTLLGMFTGIAEDGSTASRTDSYGLAWQFIAHSPWLGRGFATFLPSYRILDNQYLGLLIEVGLIGVLAVLALLVTALVIGVRTTSRADTGPDRSLARAMTTTVAVAALSFATFDAFGFPMVPGLLFLMIGLIGASADVLSPSRTPLPESSTPEAPRRRASHEPSRTISQR